MVESVRGEVELGPAASTAGDSAAGVAAPAGRGLVARWERFWFGEASLVRLALFRIVLFAAAFDGVWVVRKAVFQHAAGVEAAYLRRGWNPIYAFELLGLGPPGEHVHLVWGALLAALALGIVGLFTRTACALAALLTLYWIGSEYSFGKPHHTCVALAFGLVALPFGPVGARLSLDSLLRRLRAARRGGDPLAVPERASWAALPLLVTQITIAIGYFFSGATKLAVSGLEWANGYTLMGIMIEYRSAWSEFFFAHHALLVLMSATLLFGQAGFPLVFLWSPLRWFFVPLAVLFHVMAMQTMATGTFLTLWLALSAFVALERVPGFLARNVGAGPWWRRVLVGGTFAVLAWVTAAIYWTKKPVWLPWLLVPVALTLVLSAVPRLLPAVEVVHDPRDARQRRAVAWLAACDWARRLVFRVGQGSALRVRTRDGRQRAGSAALGAVLVRLPVAPLCAPFVAASFRPRSPEARS